MVEEREEIKIKIKSRRLGSLRRDIHFPDEVAGEEGEWNEDDAVEDGAVAEEDEDEGEMIAQIEIGPAAVLNAHDDALDEE